jgi:hypothetical protein
MTSPAPQGGRRTHQCSADICDDGRPHSVYDCPHNGAGGDGCDSCTLSGKGITLGEWEAQQAAQRVAVVDTQAGADASGADPLEKRPPLPEEIRFVEQLAKRFRDEGKSDHARVLDGVVRLARVSQDLRAENARLQARDYELRGEIVAENELRLQAERELDAANERARLAQRTLERLRPFVAEMWQHLIDEGLGESAPGHEVPE